MLLVWRGILSPHYGIYNLEDKKRKANLKKLTKNFQIASYMSEQSAKKPCIYPLFHECTLFFFRKYMRYKYSKPTVAILTEL